MTKLAIALTEFYADWEVALLMAEGRSSFGLDFTVASPGARPVKSMGGIRVVPEVAVERLDPQDHAGLVVCGGEIWQTDAAPDFGSTIRAFAEAGKLVAGICAGTLALARAGVLDEVTHTSNEAALLATSPAYRGQAFYRDQPAAVSDRMIITAPGTAPITFTAEIFRALGRGSREMEEYLALFGREHGAN
ncbi:glutamine amidotransferase [Metarhizobium album]|uniref:Glutamine amidotransferase n=1 Tax=Metarhizobium album TaxID=2182425 RepID=A0A2U2DY54_9HYPH|nr:DJ-1/PfpI family protein [Rhizobium album]PWE58132.1 glutamine amidotransferase [Rhizobium album]